jgi:predicted deacylase
MQSIFSVAAVKAVRRLALSLLLISTWTLAQAATTFTGDKIQGVPVITRLDVDDLAPGKTYRFMFQGVEMGTGEFWYVPVMVAKGGKPGKRILLVSGVHGDELNPIAAVQQVFADLDASTLSGSVIGIVGLSRPGVEWVTRTWPMSNLGTTLINPNRTWPGEEAGNTVERHCWLITDRLIKGNVDVGVDFHTGGNGIEFALFVFAYASDAEAQRMAELFPVDQIMADPGLPGTLEYALVRAGIPALTVELGGPRGFDAAMIRVGVEGAENLLAHYKMIDRPLGRTAKYRNVFHGNGLEDIVSVTGGFVEVLVKVNDAVKKGQQVAIQRNAFGDVVHEYAAGRDGRVAIIGTDAIRERGVDLVTILTNRTDCPANGCPYHVDE